jgi:hypothetical protein
MVFRNRRRSGLIYEDWAKNLERCPKSGEGAGKSMRSGAQIWTIEERQRGSIYLYIVIYRSCTPWEWTRCSPVAFQQISLVCCLASWASFRFVGSSRILVVSSFKRRGEYTRHKVGS